MADIEHYAPMAHLQTDGAQVFSLWHNEGMTGHLKRPHTKRPRDFSQAAKLVVDIASGQVEDREPTPEEQGKDPAAVAYGRERGRIGGSARAESLSADRRREIASKAALKRWHRDDPQSSS